MRQRNSATQPAALILPVLLALTGCNTAPPAEDAALDVLARSQQCGIEQQGWSRIESRENIPPALQQRVDLQENLLTLWVAMGQRPTGGYHLELPPFALRDGDGVHFDVILHAPPEDAVVTQALTSPCAVVQLDAPADERVNLRMVGPEVPPIDPRPRY